MLFERKPLNDIFATTPELCVKGDWRCINIETKRAWPTQPQPFTFESHTLWVIPHSTDHYPGLAINRPSNLSPDDAWALLHRALSLITWVEGSGAMVVYMSGGNLPRMVGAAKSNSIFLQDVFDLTDLPSIESERGRLALALIREGRGLNHPAYAFLSFFRALETAVPDGRARSQWVTENIGNIEGHQAKAALQQLRASVQGDIGVHLRDTGRHAVAHAQADPIVNPDDPRDARRLAGELPIIEALAVLAIEQNLGIQTSQTIWRQHLYELRGWKRVFGDALIAAVLEGIVPEEVQQIDPPLISVRLRRSDPFPPFEKMQPHQVGFGQGKVEVTYVSGDGLVALTFWLNFAEERLEFDPQRSIDILDDGSAAAARNRRDIEIFLRDYFGNGELQIWDVNNKALISRCGAFIPVNCYLDTDAANACIERWNGVIADREEREANDRSSQG